MMYLLTIILAIIGSIVAWGGYPIGMLGVLPLFVMYAANEMRLNSQKKVKP